MSDFYTDEDVLVAAMAMFAEGQCDRLQREDVQGNWDGRLDEADQDEYRALTRAVLAAVAPAIAARAWDEGHRTPQVREPDDCQCYAYYAGECGCGKFGTGRIITPNPYREEAGR